MSDLAPTGARPSEDARQIVEKHRRHVELSPGVGEDVQRYALAVLDDVLADFRRSPRLPSAEDSGAPAVVCCYDCGLAYGSEGWIECILPAETWAKVSPTGDAGGILCITCIARRAQRMGLVNVPVMLCGTEVLRVATQDEAFDRGWKCAEKRIGELEAEVASLRSVAAAAPSPDEISDHA